MENVTLAPLRWVEEPSQVTILGDEGRWQAYFQTTGVRNLSGMCRGRPVEELPRILSILSPAHHLVSAMALDGLFDAEPPAPAANVREALLQALFFKNHLRKLYFLLASFSNPFQPFSLRGLPTTKELVPQHMSARIMGHLALSQEAASILGGRSDHPMSAVPGGVSRFPKEPHYPRLAEIAAECSRFAVELANFLGETVFQDSIIEEMGLGGSFTPMSFVATNRGRGEIVVRDPMGKETDRFPTKEIFRNIGFEKEAWTYQPFAYLADHGWRGLEKDVGGLFFVGPLARLNGGENLERPQAEEERQRLVNALGPFPHFTIRAACWALAVELVLAGENMVDLCFQEKLTGPAMRTMPTGMNQEGFAAGESPQGLIAHHYVTDERGLVTNVEILDTAAANNALRCLIAGSVAEGTLSPDQAWGEIKARIELSFLPF